MLLISLFFVTLSHYSSYSSLYLFALMNIRINIHHLIQFDYFLLFGLFSISSIYIFVAMIILELILIVSLLLSYICFLLNARFYGLLRFLPTPPISYPFNIPARTLLSIIVNSILICSCLDLSGSTISLCIA